MADDNSMMGKVGLDTTGFKAGVNDINEQIRVIETGFRATAAVMGDWSSKSEGLTSRLSSLNEKLELQKLKLNILHAEYDKAVAEQGASSKAASSLANQMYSAEKAISSTEADIKKYNASLEAMQTDESKSVEETKKLDNAMDEAGKSGSTAGEKIKDAMSGLGGGIASGVKAAGAAIAAVGAAAVGATAGIVKMVSSSVEAADGLQKLSDETGLTAEQLQIMQYQGSALGVSIDTMTGAQAKLTKAMNAAADGKSGPNAQAKAFQELGIQVRDSSGHLRSSTDVFNEAITKLGEMQNSTERDATAMAIFGKSAMELNPLIKAGGDELSRMSDEAIKNGAIMSNDAVAGLDAFGDSLDASKLALKGMAGTLASIGLPVLNQFQGMIQSLTGALNEAVRTGDFTQLGTAMSDGITKAVDMLTGAMGKILPVIISSISGLIGAVVAAIPTVLPALTDGVMQILNALIQILQTNGPMLIQAGVQAIITLASGLSQALPQIVSTGITMITALASSISAQLPTLVPIAVQTILTVVNGLLSNLQPLIDSAIKIILALVQGITNSLPSLAEQIPEIIITIINALVSALPELTDAAPQIIVSIITGIINALPTLIEEAPKIIIALIEGLVNALPQLLNLGPQIMDQVWDGLKSQDWGSIGKNIVDGIWQGIKSMEEYFTKSIKSFFGGIVSGVKKVLGINSPSTVFADIGGNLMKGLSKGINDTKDLVSDQISDVTDTISNISGSVSVKAAVNSTAASAAPSAATNGTDILGMVNAIISAINMAAAKIGSGNSGGGDVIMQLDGITTGRVLVPYLVKEFRRLGMIDSSGYIKAVGL